MPKYSRTVPVPGKTAQELYDVVERDIDQFLSKTPIGKYDLERNPARREVRFKSSMAEVSLECGEGEIHLEGSLSFLAMPFKSKLDDGIDRWLARTFSQNS